MLEAMSMLCLKTKPLTIYIYKIRKVPKNGARPVTSGCTFMKGDLGSTANCRGITPTSVTARIYNRMLLKRMRSHFDSALRINHIHSGEID